MPLPLAVSGVVTAAIVAGCALLAFLVFLFIVSYSERRPLRTLVALPPLDAAQPIHPYVREKSEQAAALGLHPAGWVRHVKHDIIGSLWFTPDRMMLLYTGAGRIAGMEAKQTWVYTWLTDGRILVTTDNFDEGDPSRLYIVKRRLKGDVRTLIDAHRQRLGGGGGGSSAYSPMIFSDASAMESVDEMFEARVNRMIERGVARWRDPQRTTWSYSARGSMLVVMDFFRQLAIGLTQFWRV